MLRVVTSPITLSVVMLNVVMLRVVAPHKLFAANLQLKKTRTKKIFILFPVGLINKMFVYFMSQPPAIDI
jgi:hypothetical protein